MTEKIKQSKRGGKRPNAGRKSKAAKTAALVEAGVLSKPDDTPEPPPKTGRPTDYKPEFAVQAEKLCRLGATDVEMADFFVVDVRSIYRWAHTHDAFCQALRAGKEAADERVERSLYNRAVGYSHDAVRIFMPAKAAVPIYAPYREHVPPDVAAASLWLRNRRGEAWRDKQEHVHRFKPEQMTDDDLAVIAARGSEGAAETPPDQSKLN